MKQFFTLLITLLALSLYSQSTLTNYLIGGSNDEYSYDHCFDSEGNFIVVGMVRGMNMAFTDTIGVIDNSNKNIFIRKYSPDMQTLISSTIISGSSHDYCKSVDIDSQGNIFIGGTTLSSDMPVSSNAYQQVSNSTGTNEAYIIKLNSDLDQVLAATYFGGEDKDYIYKMRIDQNDNIIAVGSTRSTTNIATSGAYDETYGGSNESLFHFGDAYVVKFDNNLEHKLAATYLGSEGDEACYALVVNSDNNIVITGASISDDYPVSADAFQTIKGAGYDMVITEFNSDLTQILHSTFLGGGGDDIAWDIAFNETDQQYIIGAQTSSNFNITGSVADPTANGNGDGMLLVFNSDLQSLHSVTYVGGSEVDLITSVYYSGNAIVYCGITESPNLPTSTDAYYPNYLDENNYADGFYGSINNDLSEFNHLSYFGGNDDDLLWRVSSHNGKIYVNGHTSSSNIESGSTQQGGSDAVVGVVEDIYLKIKNVPLSNSNLSVFPNPAQDYIFVKSKSMENETIRIFDITGKLVKEKQTLGFEIQIDINDLKSGVYLVKMGQQSERLIIK